jgi:hypothetical protein
MGRLRTREKYLKIKKDAHELPCNILTLLLKEPKSAGLMKEKDRDKEEFKTPNEIIPFYNILGKSLIILSIFRSRMFWFSRFSNSRIHF